MQEKVKAKAKAGGRRGQEGRKAVPTSTCRGESIPAFLAERFAPSSSHPHLLFLLPGLLLLITTRPGTGQLLAEPIPFDPVQIVNIRQENCVSRLSTLRSRDLLPIQRQRLRTQLARWIVVCHLVSMSATPDRLRCGEADAQS